MITPLDCFRTQEDIALYLSDESKLIYPIADNILFLSRHIIDPYEEQYQVFDKDDATILGMYIKQSLLYSEYTESYKSNKIHLCIMLQRIIYEAYIKMRYLIKYGRDAQTEYRLYSYKNRYRFYREHKEENGYYKVRNEKFLQDLKDDGFETTDCEKSPKAFGGKNMEQLITELDNKDFYISLYGLPSDAIHSDWGEIRQVYITKMDNGNYIPVIYNNKHFRMLIPMINLMIDSSLSFLEWSKNNSLASILSEHERIINLINEYIVDEYHNESSKYMKE